MKIWLLLLMNLIIAKIILFYDNDWSFLRKFFTSICYLAITWSFLKALADALKKGVFETKQFTYNTKDHPLRYWIFFTITFIVYFLVSFGILGVLGKE